MENLITGLNKRFGIALQKSTDKEFYLNLYHYFDYNTVPRTRVGKKIKSYILN